MRHGTVASRSGAGLGPERTSGNVGVNGRAHVGGPSQACAPAATRDTQSGSARRSRQRPAQDARTARRREERTTIETRPDRTHPPVAPARSGGATTQSRRRGEARGPQDSARCHDVAGNHTTTPTSRPPSSELRDRPPCAAMMASAIGRSRPEHHHAAYSGPVRLVLATVARPLDP